MTARILAVLQTLSHLLKPSRSLCVAAVEILGLAAVVAGVSLWSVAAALIAGGAGLVLEAYALERR